MKSSLENISIPSGSSLFLGASSAESLSSVEERTNAATSSVLDSMPQLETSDSSTLTEKKNTSSLHEKLKTLDDKLSAFEKNYEKLQIRFESEIGKGLAGAEYIDQNNGNIRAVLNNSVSPEFSQLGSDWIKQFGKIFKLVDYTCPFFINLLKYYIITDRYSQLTNQIADLKKLTPKSSSSEAEKLLHSTLTKKVEKIHSQMRSKLLELEPTLGLKFAKFISKLSTYPLEYLGMVHKDASRLSKSFFEIFSGIFDVFFVNHSVKLKDEFHFQLQPHIQIDKSDAAPQQVAEKNWSLDKNKRFDTITDFKRELLNCPNLDAIRSWLKEPSIRLDYKLMLNDLANATSLSEVHKKLRNEILNEECDLFIQSLEKCKNKDEVITLLNKKKMTTIDIPSDFERWQAQMKDIRYRRHLAQVYFTAKRERPLMNESSIQGLLRKRKKEREDNIEKARTTFIQQHIQDCVGKSFADIVAHFKNLKIDFDRIQPNPDPQKWVAQPKSENDWIALIASPAFCFALAEQWVDHQITNAQLTEQGFRQTLLSKLSVETQFLNFRWMECYLKITLGIIQLFFLWQRALFPVLSNFIQLLNTDFRKMNIPGVGIFNLFYPLYPDLSFKSDGLIMNLVAHFFAYKHKPQEYSFEAYKLSLQIRFYELQALAVYFYSLFKCQFLRLKILLIENGFQGKGLSFENDTRKEEYDKEYEASRVESENKIEQVQKRLIELKLLDAKKIISPSSSNPQSTDPFEILAASMDQIDSDYQPFTLKELFHKTLGLDLSKRNKDEFKNKMEDFLIKGEVSMMNSYHNNRLIYLRS